MRRRVALNRIRAAALVGVLAVHAGMLYALAGVRIPTQTTEAKVLYVNIVESPEAAGGGEESAPPVARVTPSRRAAEKVAPRATEKAAATPRPVPEIVRPPPPAPVEPPPADIASGERAAETPAPPTAATSPSAATDGRSDTGGGGQGSVASAGGTGTGNGAGAGRGSGAPMTLTSELALVCPERRPPPYPSVSRRLGESGRVVLRVELDESGRVIEARVVDSSGFARLDSAALTAVRTWRCTPPRQDGHPVGAVALQPFDFTLDGI